MGIAQGLGFLKHIDGGKILDLDGDPEGPRSMVWPG